MADSPEAIAIVGVGARLPGAVDAAQYWRNLRDGREATTPVTDEQLLAFGVTREELADPHYVRNGFLVPHLQDFDAELFRMTTREARVSDPQLKLFLEVSHAAIEDAGLDLSTMHREVGVFGSAGQARYTDLYVHGDLRHHDSSTVVLNNTDYIATFTAYRLDLRGPAVTVMTACSSSFVATHLACQALLLGECDLALAGGANVELPYGHGYRWGPGSVMSRDGRCRPFDAGATGTVFTNGAAAVLLKRLSDAVADRDHIRAVIHGTGINNDGSEKMSFGAPSIEGQSAAIMQAMAVAGIKPDEISYVEAHGTATAIGDPVEIAALNRAYRTLAGGDLPPGSIPIGSVKSNIGHTTPTAGVASLIKVALALEAEQNPPSVNFTEPNPRLELDKTPFFVNDRLRPWPRTTERPRWAGISSLGVGGTNVHAVVSEGPAPVRTPVDERPRLVVWSARAAPALEDARRRLAGFFADAADDVFADATTILQRGRTHHDVRAAVVAANRAEAATALADGRPATSNAGAAGAERDVVFVFPGQASQHAGMASGLYGTNPVFTAEVDRCLAELADGARLRERWLSGDDEALRPTARAQPMLFAVEYALARVLIELGIRPAAMIGHSVGELVAATLAGVLDIELAVRLVAARGELMQGMPRGSMLAVRAGVDAVAPVLPPGCSVAVVNGPDQVVVAAPAEHAAAVDALVAAGFTVRVLPTSHAFHSPAMDAAVAPFTDAAASVTLRPPTVAVYSAATGRPLIPREATDPRFWARQLVEPVRFDRAVDGLLGAGAHTLLEVGPGRALTGLMARHPAVREGRSVAVSVLSRAGRPDRDDERSLLEAVAALWVHGHEPVWAGLRPDEPLRRVPVPGYPYQRVRCWIDPKNGPAAPHRGREAPAASGAPAPPAALESASPLSTVTWSERPAPRRSGDRLAAGHAVALIPDDRTAALPLVLALQRRGYQVIRVLPGTEYTPADTEFHVRPGNAADMAAVFDALADSGRWPQLVAHGWAFDEWEPVSSGTVPARLDLAVHGLHTLVRAAARGGGRTRTLPHILVVTTGAVDVSGAAPAHPVKATLPALVRTFAAELPGSVCTLVDVAAVDEDDLVDEFAAGAGDPVVALRAGRRWVPRELPYEPGHEPPVLRREGVYLITGGLGGLGLAVAKGLAGTGLRPRLVLAGRTVPDGARAAGDERAAAVAAAVAEMEAMGARVRAQACDVTDRRAVARLIDVAVAQFGALHGVLHLAGVPGDGMLVFADRDDLDRVCRPKIQGTLALVDVVTERASLDFFVTFSSRSALAGMVGSGHYAAANAFLDAYALSVPRRSAGLGRVLSIGWPAWRTVGMAAAALRRPTPGTPPEDSGQATEFTTILAPGTCWALDEHRVDGKPVLPGTGHLDLVLAAFRTVFGVPSDTAVVFDEVLFALPLLAERPREVRVRFTADGDRYRFVVASREDGADGSWTDHVTGHVAATAGPTPEPLDVDGLLADLAEREVPTTRPSANRMFTLGPRWRTVTRVWGSGATKVVRLELPAAFLPDLDEHPLHPTLLDAATAALREPESDGLHLPFLYRRLVVHRSLPAVLFSRIRRRDGDGRSIAGDIDLVAPDGTVLAQITGFTMRRVDRDAFTGSLTGRDPAEADGEAAVPGAGVPPEQGVRLLLDLLSARTPAQVLVRPFEGGRPVPLPAAPGGADVVAPAQVWAAAGQRRPAPSSHPAPMVDPAPAAEPADQVAEQLRALWAEVLGGNGFSADVDFFESGGDSMSAVQLMGRIRDVFRVELAIDAIFEHSSIAALATLIRSQGPR